MEINRTSPTRGLPTLKKDWRDWQNQETPRLGDELSQVGRSQQNYGLRMHVDEDGEEELGWAELPKAIWRRLVGSSHSEVCLGAGPTHETAQRSPASGCSLAATPRQESTCSSVSGTKISPAARPGPLRSLGKNQVSSAGSVTSWVCCDLDGA